MKPNPSPQMMPTEASAVNRKSDPSRSPKKRAAARKLPAMDPPKRHTLNGSNGSTRHQNDQSEHDNGTPPKRHDADARRASRFASRPVNVITPVCTGGSQTNILGSQPPAVDARPEEYSAYDVAILGKWNASREVIPSLVDAFANFVKQIFRMFPKEAGKFGEQALDEVNRVSEKYNLRKGKEAAYTSEGTPSRSAYEGVQE